MKKLTKILIVLIIILILFIIIFQINRTITGRAIKEEPVIKTYTKAICNSSNYCQDYEVICEDNKTKEIRLIENASAQFSQDWEDPRTQKEIDKLC